MSKSRERQSHAQSVLDHFETTGKFNIGTDIKRSINDNDNQASNKKRLNKNKSM